MIGQERLYTWKQILQVFPVRRDNNEVIGIPSIMLYMKRMFHKLIELIHIDVRKQLACQIANRYAMTRAFTLSLSLSR